jgi:uncharacterized protein with HEPN domain
LNSDLLYLEHILECVRRIKEYVAGGRDSYFGSTLVQDAVIRNLQTLAESSMRVGPESQAMASGIPWKQILGFRNLLVHEYLRIDLEFVWHIISVDLPALKEQILLLRDVVQQRR